MISKSIKKMVDGSSAIRAMFEEGARRAAKYGAENVYDFSLGNPSVEAPAEVNQAIKDIVDEEKSTFLHGYNQSNSGYKDVREKIANFINKKYGTSFDDENIIMTVGAAGGLNVALKTLLDPGDEVVAFSPYFVEYRNYVSNYGGVLKTCKVSEENFQPDEERLREAISTKTKAVIINSPNNPTGVVYSEETLKKLTRVLREKEEEFGKDIYIISDEPYRELAYDGIVVPYVTKFYDNTIVCYSWSKSLSLPGERIGYMIIPSEISDFEETKMGANIANRVMGFVNAPTLIQRVVGRCVDCKTDIGAYDKNRKALYEGLRAIGFECIKPEGAFYLFVKSPTGDDKEFCQLAKEYNILMVPGSAFDCPGYVRLAYCMKYETIMNSLPKFKELWSQLK